MRVAFQGERGAYSEEAAVRLFGPAIELLPRRTFQAVFEAVEKGDASHGVVPVENSQTGGLGETLDLLLQFPVHVTQELTLLVHHCLLGRVSLAEAKTAHSHPQALAQCAEFLATHGLTAIAEYDTAGSAKLLAEGRLPLGAAAIASRVAAHTYGLEILSENIETHQPNFTRFYGLEKAPRVPQTGGKTAIAFALDNSPGSLHAALGALASRGLSIARLDPRPRKNRPWEYVFYLEFSGNIRHPEAAAALSELEQTAIGLRVIGCFETLRSG